MRAHPGTDLGVETTEVLGQRRLLRWAVPGTAHLLTFWGFTMGGLDDSTGRQAAASA